MTEQVGFNFDSERPLDVLKGERCPRCNQWAQKYHRNINDAMVLGLLACVTIFKKSNDWVHYNDIDKIVFDRHGKKPAEFSKLRFWGFIIKCPNDNPRKKSSGYWKPTETGIAFLRGETKAMKRAWLYDNKLVDWEGPQITVMEALSKKFDYQKLMKGI